nr:transposase family protein [Leuconostoc litchii]
MGWKIPSFVKWGFKTVRYLLNDVSEYKTYLKIKKQRFRCKICGKTLLPRLP